MRAPMAWETALAMAPAVATVAGSPMPTEWVLLTPSQTGRRIVSISGTSLAPGNLVLLDVRVDHLACRPVEHSVFVKGVGNALDDAALHLAFGRQGVHDEAAVVDGHDLLDLDPAGLRVDFDLGKLSSRGEALPGVAMVLRSRGRGRHARLGQLRAGSFPGKRLRIVALHGEDTASDLDCFRSHVPAVTQDLGDLLLGLPGRGADARRRGGRRRRAAGGGTGRHRGAANADMDLFERESQFLRGHDADHRARARPEVLNALLDVGRAVAVNGDRGPGARAARVVPDGRSDADAALDGRVLRGAPGIAVLPSDPLCPETEFLAPDLGGVVAGAEVERVDAELFRELVHHRFESEGALRMAGSPERGGRACVREHVELFGSHVVAGVDVLERPGGSGAPVGPSVAVHDEVERRQLAVFGRARLDPLDRGGAVSNRQVLLLAVEEELDRRPGLLREPGRRHALDARPELGAEASAHVFGRDMDLGLVEGKDVGQLVAHREHALCRSPDLQAPVGLPGGHEAVRLESRVRLDLRDVRAFDENVGLLKAFVNRGPCRSCAGPARCRPEAAPSRPPACRPPRLCSGTWPEKTSGAPGLRAVATSTTKGRVFVFHLDRGQGIRGLIGRFGSHGRDRLPRIAHRLARLGDGEGGPDARHLPGGPEVNRGDDGRGMGAAEDLAVEHPREPHVN